MVSTIDAGRQAALDAIGLSAAVLLVVAAGAAIGAAAGIVPAGRAIALVGAAAAAVIAVDLARDVRGDEVAEQRRLASYEQTDAPLALIGGTSLEAGFVGWDLDSVRRSDDGDEVVVHYRKGDRGITLRFEADPEELDCRFPSCEELGRRADGEPIFGRPDLEPPRRLHRCLDGRRRWSLADRLRPLVRPQRRRERPRVPRTGRTRPRSWRARRRSSIPEVDVEGPAEDGLDVGLRQLVGVRAVGDRLAVSSSASHASFVSMPTMSFRMPGSSATWRARTSLRSEGTDGTVTPSLSARPPLGMSAQGDRGGGGDVERVDPGGHRDPEALIGGGDRSAPVRPGPSAPTRNATRSGRCSEARRSPPGGEGDDRRARRPGRGRGRRATGSRRANGTWRTWPIDTRTGRRPSGSAVSGSSSTASTPKARALRNSEPRFSRSLMRSATTTRRAPATMAAGSSGGGPLGGGDHAAVQLEADRRPLDVEVGDEHRRARPGAAAAGRASAATPAPTGWRGRRRRAPRRRAGSRRSPARRCRRWRAGP